MISWLAGPAIVALAGSFIITRIFEFLADILIRDTPEAAKGIVFTSAWAVIQTKLGMDGTSKTVRDIKSRTGLVSDNRLVKSLIKRGTK